MIRSGRILYQQHKDVMHIVKDNARQEGTCLEYEISEEQAHEENADDINDRFQAQFSQVRQGKHKKVALTDRVEEGMALLRAAPHVLDVQIAKRTPRRYELDVSFDGDDAVQTSILTQLIERGLPVIGFEEAKIELEDVFMQVTKGIVS